MQKKTYLAIGFICLLSLFLYLPSLGNFFTNDDFFHLKISQAASFVDFLRFFDLSHSWSGFGHYRPLTTQFIYFWDIYLFRLNPLPLHLLSYIILFILIFVVYKLANEITKDNKISLLAAFFYGVSATHFGRIYFIGGFQELGVALFYFLTVLSFIRFLTTSQKKYYFVALLCFIGALMSKELSVTIPITLTIIFIYFKFKLISTKKTPLSQSGVTKTSAFKLPHFESNYKEWFSFKLENLSTVPRSFSSRKFINKSLAKHFLFIILPFVIILSIYLYLHVFYYGLATGDSYIWTFSSQLINTLFWYFLWSLNIPEMLVDYVGPGLNINPNLFKYYADYIFPIFILFIVFISSIFIILIKNFHKIVKQNIKIYLLAIVWFIVTLIPVLFLPWHKFSLELTIPLFGSVLLLSMLVSLLNKKLMVVMLIVYFFLSVFTNILTYKTHWVVQGGQTARRALDYINNIPNSNFKSVFFYNTNDDKDLPWKPSEQLKNVLSGNNAFEVFYQGKIKAFYSESDIDSNDGLVRIKARDLLKY